MSIEFINNNTRYISERCYYIIAMRNREGDEILVGVKSTEQEANDFCESFDKSQIPVGYKMGYILTFMSVSECKKEVS